MKNSNDLSYEILLSINNKLINESKIFHKVKNDEIFTSNDVAQYALSQVQTKKDELELYKVLKKDYIDNDYMPDVKKIQTFNNLIEGSQLNIDFYTLMAQEFSKKD